MRRIIASWITAIALPLVSPVAVAQTQEATSAETAGPEGVEAIEIVGEKIDVTDVQDEAQAITAFSAEDLDRASIFNVDSLAYSVPGLHVGQSGQQAIITLRGIGTENASITGEPGVAFHVDGINFAQPSAARLAFFDLETLDVKRGPQGLRGGKNSNSGTINVVTKKPHDDYEVDGDVLFGNYDRVRARGAINIPLGEHAATRFAFIHEDRDGYLDNLLVSDSRDPFDVDDFGMRAHLRLTPSDRLDMVLSYNYFKQTGNGPQGDLVPRDPYAPSAACVAERLAAGLPAQTRTTPTAACFFEQPDREFIIVRQPDGSFVAVPAEPTFRPSSEDSDPREIFSDLPSAQDNRFWGWTGTVDWDAPAMPLLGETRVRALGGFQRSDLVFRQDFDASDIAWSDLDTDRGADQHSAELQWSGALAERLDWQLSTFYLREAGYRDLTSQNLSVSVDEGDDQPRLTRIGQTTVNKSYGTALHGTYHVTDTIRFELGGRWIRDGKHTRLLRERAGLQSDDTFVGCTGALGRQQIPGTNQFKPARTNTACTLNFRGTSWGSVLDWRPFGGDHLLYAKIDRGFKSGGFRSGGRGEYLPEKIWAYALGTKSTLFDNRVELNIEGFFYAYEDMQLVVLDGFSLRTENADTRMYGFDLEAKATPLPGLNLSAIVSHLKTETREYFSLDPGDVANPEGFPPGTDQGRIENWQEERLRKRREAEDNAEDGNWVPDYLVASCLRPPPAPAGSTSVPCGSLRVNGFDDFSGNQLARSPEWKITVAAEYEIPLGRWGQLTPRVQYTWQDDTYYRVFNRGIDLQKAHHLTDLKLIWSSPEDRWEAEVFVNNIEDEAPKQNIFIGSSLIGSPALAWYGPPRFYGARIGFRY